MKVARSRRPLPLPLGQHRHRPVLAERVVVDGGLDLEDLHAGVADDLAHAPVRVVQLGLVAVHERPALLHRLHVVVVAQAAVAGQAGGGRLVAAVHGHDVDVDVDEQVALGRSLVDLHLLALVGRAEEGEVVGVLRVVVVEEPLRGEGVVHTVADRLAELALGHPAVQRERGDEVHVVDAGGRGHVEHRFDHPLADVGALHRRQAGSETSSKQIVSFMSGRSSAGAGLAVERLEQRVLDGLVDVVDRLEGLARVDDPRPPRRQLLEAEALAVVEQDRRGRAVDVEDESGAGHQRLRSFSSRTVEGDLHRAAPTGVGRVLDRLGVPGQGIGGRHQPAEIGLADQAEGGLEVVDPV